MKVAVRYIASFAALFVALTAAVGCTTSSSSAETAPPIPTEVQLHDPEAPVASCIHLEKMTPAGSHVTAIVWVYFASEADLQSVLAETSDPEMVESEDGSKSYLMNYDSLRPFMSEIQQSQYGDNAAHRYHVAVEGNACSHTT